MIAPIALAALALVQTPAAPTEPRLMRFPTVRGDTVVFTYAGDLWVDSVAAGGLARRLTSSPGTEVRAKISPDGRFVAFTGQYEGQTDAYVVPIEGGEPKRLTFDADGDNVLGWTPDGRIAFASTAGQPFLNRQQRLWTVSKDGGLPRRTVLNEVTELTYLDGTGDKVAINRVNSYNFNWRRYRGGTQGRIGIYDFKGNTYKEIPTGREQNYFPMSIGNEIYYISDRDFGTLNLYRYDRGNGKIERLTEYRDADIRYPSTDGTSIVWERDGYLWRYDVASGAATRLAPKIAAENLSARPYVRNLGTSIDGYDLSPTGARVVVSARGEIFTLASKTGDPRNLSNDPDAREQAPTWAPDGQNVAYVSDATGEKEIYLRPQRGGDAVKLTNLNGKANPTGMAFSPDSKKLYVVTEDGANWVLDVATKGLTQISDNRYGGGAADWSPDSRWIAYTRAGTNRFPALYLYEVATGKSTQITDGRYADGEPAFDLGGKYLYLTSNRTFAPGFGDYEFSLKVEDTTRVYAIPLTKDATNPLIPVSDEEPEAPKPPPAAPPAGPPPGDPANQTPPPAAPPAGAPPMSGGSGATPPPARPATPAGPPPIKVDLDGMAGRMFPLPLGPGSYRNLVGGKDAFFVVANGSLIRFGLNEREASPLLPQAFGPVVFNPSRTKMATFDGRGIAVLDVRPGLQPGQGRVDTSGMDAVIDPRREWRQIYRETWRYLRDNYYDPQLRGLDWKGIGQRYEGYLKYVNSRADLNYVLGLLIGETGTGHSYVSGGDFGQGPTPMSTGMLGADFEVGEGGKIRLRKVYRGESYEEARRGPLAEPGTDVKDGDYLLAIDGLPVDENTAPGQRLMNKAGRYVTLTLASSPNGPTRQVRVRPIGSETQLRYADFVEANRRYVTEKSGGRIGYMHIPNTAAEGATEFVRGFYSQTDKDAVIVDERWNGGGYIQPWFVDTLARRYKARIAPRYGVDDFDQLAIEGPKAMLINGYAGSGGDFFPWMFRQARLGPLIGARTWGGLVGINSGLRTVDGGTVNAPSFAIYDRDTGDIIAENTGVDPDIPVDWTPDLAARGIDPQLDRAIAYLTEQLKKQPAPKPPRTKAPQVAPPGRVGG